MDDLPLMPEKRPLWRKIVDFPLVTMLIALLVVMVCFVIAVPLTHFFPYIPGLSFELDFDLASIPLLILGYELVIRHLGEHPRDDYRDPKWLRNLALGLGSGFLIFSLAVAVAAAIGVYQLSGKGDASDLVPALVGPALFAAVSEELMFRGILFRWFEEFGGSWMAVVTSSAAFGASHLTNPNASAIAVLGIALEAGVMLGAAYMLTRSLWLPMGIHAAWNFAQGEIFDIPVSGTKVHGLVVARLTGDPLLTGNGFGLEASIIAIVIATVFGLWLLWLAIKRGELVQPMWVRRRMLSDHSTSASPSA